MRTCNFHLFLHQVWHWCKGQSMTKNLISCEERCPILFLRFYAARVGLGNSFVEKMIVSGLAVILENGCQIQLSNDTVRTDLRICLVSEIDILRFKKKFRCASMRSKLNDGFISFWTEAGYNPLILFRTVPGKKIKAITFMFYCEQ